MPDALASVNRLGVVGAGTMGTGIVETAIVAGLPTVLTDPSPAALARAEEAIAGE
jgi:3-hydroxybutyryl-CoA dehydrogenase